MFIEVNQEELIIGEKYKITSSPNHVDYYTGILKENFIKNDRYIQVFDRFIYHSDTGKTKGTNSTIYGTKGVG
jgi:hypothetical protein